ncbi:MAG: hypothetical protein AB7N76_10095 [Planctomycetota bacterium]
MKRPLLLLSCLLLFGIGVVAWSPAAAPGAPVERPEPSPPAVSPRYAVSIPAPESPRVLAPLGGGGQVAEVACSVCHSARTPRPETAAASELDEFHQGLTFAHGRLACLACHDARDYDRLHLADGRPLAFADSLELCGQCHGPKRRDYDHGAHGGMRGYWDLTRGGRTRNHCTSCHDPHAPAYPRLQPVFAPPQEGR